MYQRTQNDNGTYNTRCLDCFLTVGFSVDSQQELERIEAQHLCLEKLLAQAFAAQQAAEAQAAHN